MKKSIVLGLLIFPILLFGQNRFQVFNASLFQTHSIVLNQPFFNVKNYSFQFSTIQFNPKNELSLYNKTTKLNDFYSTKKDTFLYQKSVFIPKNLFYGSKIDSFNPNGSPDFSSAVLLGIINTVIGKF